MVQIYKFEKRVEKKTVPVHYILFQLEEPRSKAVSIKKMKSKGI